MIDVLDFFGEIFMYLVIDFMKFFFLLNLFVLMVVDELMRKMMLMLRLVGFGFGKKLCIMKEKKDYLRKLVFY